MLGAIVGDIVGSVYEWHPVKETDVLLLNEQSRPTDDSVMTLAVAAALCENRSVPNYADWMRRLGNDYPDAGYGGSFKRWLQQPDAGPYGSWGNGSAMRVSPIGWAYDTAEEVLIQAGASAAVTHNHPEGIKGAVAVAYALFLARTDASKDHIELEIKRLCEYDLSRSLEEIRPDYAFEVSCRHSVPEAIIAFLQSHDFESAVRNAISLGGDADTQAAIAGAIAEAFYGGIPDTLAAFALSRLSTELLQIAMESARELHLSSLPAIVTAMEERDR